MHFQLYLEDVNCWRERESMSKPHTQTTLLNDNISMFLLVIGETWQHQQTIEQMELHSRSPHNATVTKVLELFVSCGSSVT